MTSIDRSKVEPIEFFLEHAGFSYDPKTETEVEGRYRCARGLAQAEIEGREIGLSFEWRIDKDTTSSDFDDSDEPWSLWLCLCHGAGGDVVATLGGIDFGRDGEPWGDCYRRVVEAELAQEALARAD